jgi:hypothetical protein
VESAVNASAAGSSGQIVVAGAGYADELAEYLEAASSR